MTRPPRFLDRILWQRALSAREAWVWCLLLVLSPLALGGGMWLHYKLSERRGLHITASRPDAIRAAHEYAHQYGITTKGWQETMWVDLDGPLTHYVNKQPEARKQMLGHLIHPATLHVRFVNPDESQSLEVMLDDQGRPYGLHRSQPSRMDAVSRNDPTYARGLAEETMEDCLAEDMPKLHMEHEPDEQHSANGMDTFTWTAQVPNEPELTLTYTAGVRGLTLMDSSVTAKLDPNYVKTLEPYTFVRQSFVVVGWIVAVGLFLFVFVRYIQRVLQGEVSRERMLLVSALIGSCYFLYMVCGDKVAVQTRTAGSSAPYWAIVFFGGAVMFLIGAAAGAAYSGTEGDLRERYPGKLTSLDALILGRWFSRNVGSSVLLGTALAGWLLLLRGVCDFLIGDVDLSSELVDVIQMVPFSRAPWLMMLLSVPTAALLSSLVGLLLPLSFAIRVSRNRRVFYIVFGLLAYVGTCLMAERTTSTASLALIGAVRLAAMIATFYSLDFLACFVMAGVLSGVTTAVGLSQMVPFVVPAALFAGAIGVCSVASAVYGVWRGRTLSDEQVRPLYARNVAERLSLQEEVAATREAQGRLLPSECPAIPGVTVAATYRAAESVGGDFYDFLPLGPHRVGVLLTEGGQGGLATALSVALTKGYVTQKASSGCAPSEILYSLHTALDAAMIDGAQLSGVLFAVVDANERTLTYARVGTWPKLLFAADGPQPSEKVTRLSNLRDLREGSVALRFDMPVLLYTDGLAAHVKGSLESWWRSKVKLHAGVSAADFQKHMMSDLVSKSEAQDDITFIVLAPAQALVQEQVA